MPLLETFRVPAIYCQQSFPILVQMEVLPPISETGIYQISSNGTNTSPK